MSYLSIALQLQIERRRINQSELARGSGISKSYLSRLFAGESKELSDQNFIALLKYFSADSTAQAELVAARCHDARVGPGSDLVEIRVKSARPAEPREPTVAEPTPLPRETERAFAYLRLQCPVNTDLEKHIVGYARLLGMK